MNIAGRLSVLLLLAACNGPKIGAPSLAELTNAEYSGIGEIPVILLGGRWEGEPFVAGGASRPAAGLVDDFRLEGDLNGDGKNEAVVLLWSSSGGSGTFDYVAVAGYGPDGNVVNLATAPLGDRVQVRTAQIIEGRVELEVVQAGPEDAACCPGQKMKRDFVLTANDLSETKTQDQGRLSLVDLGGDWNLTRFSRDEPAPEEFQISLRIDGHRISGKAACNSYFTQLDEGEIPGEISVQKATTVTRMLCPPPVMDAEQRFLQTLRNVTSYSFLAGDLVLSWSREEASGTLRFSRPCAAGNE